MDFRSRAPPAQEARHSSGLFLSRQEISVVSNMPAPLGNQNAAKGKPWAMAIERALARRSRVQQVEALDDLADRLLEKCDEKDMTALKELGDRLDGKAVQAIAGVSDEPLVVKIVRFADTE